jgi:elongation factor G
LPTEDDYIDFDPDDLGGDCWTVSRAEPGHGRFIRHRDGTSRYGEVKVVVAPNPGISCYRFVWQPLPGSLPLPFMKDACFEGVKRMLFEHSVDGRRIGFVQVSIVDGSYHDLDTDWQALTIAASMAVQDALRRTPLVSA